MIFSFSKICKLPSKRCSGPSLQGHRPLESNPAPAKYTSTLAILLTEYVLECRCEVGLNGMVLSSPDGYRTIRSYPLNHISRWAMRGSNLVLYTKSPSDVEELTLTLQGEERTITSILDTLTCCCMQYTPPSLTPPHT